MEYYILKNEDSYITLTTINASNGIRHSLTDNVAKGFWEIICKQK